MVNCRRDVLVADGVSHLTRLTRSVLRSANDVPTTDPAALHREPWRDRGPDQPHLRATRDPRDRPRHRRTRRPRPAGCIGRRRGGPPWRRRRPPSGVRVPRRERGFRGSRRGRRAPLGRTAAVGDPGHGRQGRGAPAGGLARRPGAPRLRRRGPVRRRTGRRGRRGSAIRSSSSRPPAAAARACGPSATRDGLREALAAARREAVAAFGDDRLILERLRRGRAPRRDPGPVRCARPRRPPGRTRLLDPAATPEGPRGVALTGRRCRPARTASAWPPCARAGGRLRQGAGTCEFLVDDRGRQPSSR